METEVILSGCSLASEVNEMTVHQQTTGGGTTTAACEEVFATIHMETEQMLADVDDNNSGARGNSAEIEKVADQWVAIPAPKKGTRRNVCLSFIYDRVLRLNDGATTHDACQYALEMYRVLQAKGELRLNDFVYDNFDRGQLWVLGGQQRRGGTPVSQDDARRDPRWGWVPSAIPFGYGRVEMQVRDIMGNVWSAHYMSDMFSFRHFVREATADEKEAMTCRPRDARIFDPPLGNPVELALAEGMVFSGEKCITYVHFLVVVTRVSVCNPHVKDRGLPEEHPQRCWEKIREEERQMVCMGYDSHNDQTMWSIVEDSCTEQARPSTDDMFLEGIRRRHGCTSLLGWVPVVCPMTYEHGEQMCMRFRDPLGVPFQLTYIDGLLRHIQYVGDDDARAASNAQPTTQQQQDISHLLTQVDGPETTNDRGCSNAEADDGVTPTEHVTGRAEKKKKQCTSRPPRGLRSSTKARAAAVPVPKRRRRAGMAALAGIRQLQRSTHLCIALRPFMRVVREVIEKEIAPGQSIRFQMNAIRASLEVAKVYLINHFERTNIIAIHCKRVKIQLKDLRLVDNLAKTRWEYKYEGIIDEQKRAEKLRQMNAARQVERQTQAGKGVSQKTAATRKGGDTPAGSSKRKGAPRKGNAAKKSMK
ncbi:hypothetical protein CBR_g32147 [Chara braunii]|uniref:Core Histone H2A/H2B/H3 domain-containing protein n=1 Tax=Chara braunii TaxID=69332 RepID=A0A388JMS4_CHABU|nr:hypothetical protein CBR_g32147 [Chara braunii]|eukprot:GBG59130.1 hypothetical protein CBR_g32147 [Chara braunii]